MNMAIATIEIWCLACRIPNLTLPPPITGGRNPFSFYSVTDFRPSLQKLAETPQNKVGSAHTALRRPW